MSVLNNFVDESTKDDERNDNIDVYTILKATVKSLLPGELAKHAINEGKKAVERFTKVTNRYKQEKFTIKEVKQSMIEMRI